MAESILWEADPHTIAKHRILQAYLEAWAPILLQSHMGRIVYIDGFAGSGEYTNGYEGSPIIALKTIVNHAFFPKFTGDITMLFIEIKPERAEHLEALIKTKFSNLPNKIHWEVKTGDFGTNLKTSLDGLHKEKKRLAPTFCFVDPFGWKDIDVDLLSEFMLENKAELFITFMVGFIDRFSGDERNHKSMSKIYGKEQIDEINKQKTQEQKEETTLKLFIKNIKDTINKKGKTDRIYDLSFAAISRNNRLIYYLVYLTSHLKGLKVMKEAMFAIGKDKGSFRFNDFLDDQDPGRQGTLMDYNDVNSWQNNAGEDLYKAFEGKKTTVNEVENYTWTDTRWIFRKGILQRLEKKNLIRYLSKRKKNALTYDDYGNLEFV